MRNITNTIKLIEEEFKIEKEELEEIKEKLRWLNFDGYDYIEIGDGEYRIILEEKIEDIFKNSVIELVRDCYLPKDLHNIIECNIDRDGIVEDFEIAWYWEHFSSYDGNEIYWYWIYLFRTN